MKYISTLLLLVMSLASLGGPVASFGIDDITDLPYEGLNEDVEGEQGVEVAKVIQEDVIEEEQGVVQRIMSTFGINYKQTEGTDQTATYYAKEVINWFLAIMGLIAVVVVIFGFYKMFTVADGEEGFTSAKKMTLNAVLAIAIIAVSWFLVSWFFSIYEATLGTTSG